MAVALIMDFPGGSREQYDKVLEQLDLGGKMVEGGMVHVAGSYEGGWRVIDVWESMAKFDGFRSEQLEPAIGASGLGAPNVKVLEVAHERGSGSAAGTTLAQVVYLEGMDEQSFLSMDEKILPGGSTPNGLTFHVNGPLDGGWCVIDGWTSQQLHDEFIANNVMPAMAEGDGPPKIEVLMVEATLSEPATATA